MAQPRGATVASLAQEWWETSVSELSPTTRRGYRRLLDARIVPALGRKRVTQLATRDLDRYYTELADGSSARRLAA